MAGDDEAGPSGARSNRFAARVKCTCNIAAFYLDLRSTFSTYYIPQELRGEIASTLVPVRAGVLSLFTLQWRIPSTCILLFS
jgi:hypothetical protein